MIKLHASYARKVPGQEQYSSDSASASVEIELPEGANIPAKLAELWDANQKGSRYFTWPCGWLGGRCV